MSRSSSQPSAICAGLRVSGSRAVNGCEVSQARLTSLAGCVHQEDLLIGTLTVREHLQFQVT